MTAPITPNPDQQKVIDHREGALIVISGAGSGKTSTVAERSRAMVSDGIPMSHHLLLTFSRKAVEELGSRLEDIVPPHQRSGQITTFHGFGWRFLRRFPQACSRGPGVTLLDEADQIQIYRRAAQSVGFATDGEDRSAFSRAVRHIRSVHSLIRNDGVVDELEMRQRMSERLVQEDILPHHRVEAAVSVAMAYEAEMRQSNLVDYDHLVNLPVRCLEEKPKAAQWLQRRYPYLTVDEAQDTNRAQYALIRAVGGHGNVILVGDDDQVLFTWRGARSENLQRFANDFDADKAFLTRNYRSRPAIVAAAGNLIAHNKKRLDKRPFAEGDAGSPPSFVSARNGFDMAQQVVSRIREQLRSGAAPEDVAVLYRTKRLARVLEPELRRQDVPYRLVGSRSLYDTREVRTALAISRLIQNPLDSLALSRVGEWLPGMGKVTAGHIQEWMSHCPSNPLLCPADEMMERLVDLPKAGYSCFLRLRQAVDALIDRSRYGPAKLGAWLMAEDGLDICRLKPDASADDVEERDRRRRNLELMDAVHAEMFASLGPDDDPWAALAENALTDAAPERPGDDEEGRITLSTIHRAKGMEWDHVHIVGATDGLMPLARSVQADEDDTFSGGLEEERRLAYVAVTRARLSASLFHAQTLSLPGDQQAVPMRPSPFLEEMGIVKSPRQEARDVSRPRQSANVALDRAASSDVFSELGV